MKLSVRVNLRCWTDGAVSVPPQKRVSFYTGDALNQFQLEKTVACTASVASLVDGIFNRSIVKLINL